MKKRFIGLLGVSAAVAAGALFAETPSADKVSMVQAEDAREVTISYTLTNGPAVVTFDVETNAVVDGVTVWASIGGRNLLNVSEASDANRRIGSDGAKTIRWYPECDWATALVAAGRARAVVKAWPLNNTPDYMVVDITLGSETNSQRYYESADLVPGGVLGNRDYRTTKLLMRKIPAKNVAWTMGPEKYTHEVTLDHNYYMAVFETTQTQYQLIKTNNSYTAYFNNVACRSMRPAEKLVWRGLRNNPSNNVVENYQYNWPNDPHPGSFIGLLRLRTGLDFDLPGEAEWEFACRSGKPNGYWNTGVGTSFTSTDSRYSKDDNLPSRYRHNGGFVNGTDVPAQNCPTNNGTAVCGSSAPNGFGLYDMHGNVREFCLDFYQDHATAARLNGRINVSPADPKKAIDGTTPANEVRVVKGGFYYEGASQGCSGSRGSCVPWDGHDGTGVRVVCRAGLD